MPPQLFTVGHSNTSFRDFLVKLKVNGITAIADVRSLPYSGHVPHFSWAELKLALQEH